MANRLHDAFLGAFLITAELCLSVFHELHNEITLNHMKTFYAHEIYLFSYTGVGKLKTFELF